MRTLTIRNHFQGNSTIVENDFIDNHMIKANGEYVKVYLLLLRHLNNQDAKLTISVLADILECTEKDILRALKHWSKVGLLKIDYDEAGTICGISMGATPADTNAPVVNENVAPKSSKKSASSTPKASKELQNFKQLYFVAEQYLGKPLTVTDIRKINYFYDSLHFSIDLIEYLIEYCVEKGHKNMHYIESVALSWSDKNITSVDAAKEEATMYHQNSFAILKAFGISGRNPALVESNYMKKWAEEYGFSLEIIIEACNRTIAYTAKPDFKYADSILRNWVAQDVHSLEDIAKLDSARKQEKPTRKKVSPKPAVSSANRFNNFEGRSYDLSSLEQQLLNTP